MKYTIKNFKINAKLFTFMFFLANHSLAQAEGHLLILGGGGEPQKESTIFDEAMRSFGNNLKKSKWKYEVSFNGGHRKTENILKNQYSKGKSPPTDFTNENFIKLIENYKNKILSGEIKSGDQMMIMINAHGAETSYQELTHSISLSGGAVTNLNTLEGSEKVSLDKLQEIVKLTNERGINLGIIDLSCHSGSTLKLKKNSTNTCIITASGPNHYGFTGTGSFINNFHKNIKPGTSLEEVFLKSRLDSKTPDYPMISTNENNKIATEVYKNISPYLYYYAPEADKMSSYVFMNSNPLQLCEREENFNKLIAKIDSLKSILHSNKNRFNTDELRNLLFNYKKSQDEIFKAIEKMGVLNLEKVETFIIPENSSSFLSQVKTKHTWSELLLYNFDNITTNYEKLLANSKSAPEKQDNQSMINLLKQLKTKKQQILTENPKLVNHQYHTDLMIKAMSNSEIMAKKIAAQEKRLYEELYRRDQSANPNDPCKKIIF